MGDPIVSQPCEKLKTTFLEQITPQLEALTQSFSWAGLFEVFDDVVQAVENMQEIGNGPQKKACAIDIVITAYEKHKFDIPYLPNMFEKRMLEWILDVAIDGIVAILNKRGIFVHGTE